MRAVPTQEDALLLARIKEAVENARFRNRPSFIGFLDERQSALAVAAVGKQTEVTVMTDGGYAQAERTVCGIFPSFLEPDRSFFPIGAVTVRYRKEARLTHRDLLGSLMALGIEREVLGDLLLEEGRAVFFAKEEMIPYFLQELTQIGREGIQIQEGFEEPLPLSAKTEEISATVASPRLDCVVAALCSCSRTLAAEWIEKGNVTLNRVECESLSAIVCEGDKISVRGKGRYVVFRLGPQTKKGRLGFLGGKYV